MKSLGNFSALAFFAAITLTLSSCGVEVDLSTPEATGRTYAAAFSGGDKSALDQCMSKADKDVFTNVLKEEGATYFEDDPTEFIEAKTEKIGDKTYNVITMKNEGNLMMFALIQEDGLWKVSIAETGEYTAMEDIAGQ